LAEQRFRGVDGLIMIVINGADYQLRAVYLIQGAPGFFGADF
jgi:hypothetical protein